jgi:cytochrome c biogenesis protein CcmG/thiol:disulfide interchange protein DsbE
MTSKRSVRRKYSKTFPMVLVGVGLVIIGIVALNALPKGSASPEYSVVPAAVSFTAPELNLSDIDGNQVSLSSYRQDIVLVNNWATWCPPCKLEMPTLLKYFQAHSVDGFMLVAIEAGESAQEVRSFADEYGLTFPVLLDPENRSLAAFHNSSLPSSYVIDRSGTVVFAWTGPISLEMLENYVTPLLGQ